MNKIHEIDILLSTYNGESYLRDLLDSIISQSFTDWRLLVRDDGSKDKTLSIIEEYSQKYPYKIFLIEDLKSQLGPSLSFGELMGFSTAPFVMFCDQDDVWLKDKIKLSFNKIMELEEKFSSDLPLLVYTDSKLTDESLNVIANSAQELLGIDQRRSVKFRNLILRNVIIGNTTIANRRLIKLSCPIKADIVMHDWWLGLIASAFGHIGYVPEATILYRQHDQNVCGLEKTTLLRSRYFSNFKKEYRKYFDHQRKIHKQIKAFYGRFNGVLSAGNAKVPEDVIQASCFTNLDQFNYWKRTGFLLSFYKDCPYRLKAFIDLILYYKIFTSYGGHKW